MKYVLGIDLGGSSIKAVTVTPEGHLLAEAQVPFVDRDREWAYKLRALVRDFEAQQGAVAAAIGIAAPGLADPAGRFIAHMPGRLIGIERLDWSEWLGTAQPIPVLNDAHAALLGEVWLGAARGLTNAFMLTLGTGVGGGLVADGKVIQGLHGIGGEWGHNHLDDSGGTCFCGKTGCVEKILSGPALEAFYQSISGNKKSLKEIYSLHKNGDEFAQKTIDRLTYFFGKATSVVINIVDPDVIVVGGGVGNIEEIYSEGLIWAKKFSFNRGVLNTHIVKPKLGDSAGVFGAATLTA